MMKLQRFRVQNYRSVDDSGWIECDDVTTLVGINEAGKSNLILALWKLKPARGGVIDLLHDMPATKYAEWRLKSKEIPFISAEFKLEDSLIDRISAMCGCDRTEASTVRISRHYDKHYRVVFSNYQSEKTIPSFPLRDIASKAIADIDDLDEKTKAENGIKQRSLDAYKKMLKYLNENAAITVNDITHIASLYPVDKVKSASSVISPYLEQAQKAIDDYLKTTKPVNPSSFEEVRKLAIAQMPSFVYYSNYGNLDAQIYLPHAMKWLNGETVEGIEISEDKVRTLRVLFEFVNLNPEEILELGEGPITRKVTNYNQEITVEATEAEVESHMKNVEERFTLLSSAASSLTTQFRDWWKQGDYTFRFEADGGYFRILVSDDKRPEEIQLEKRSTGLQWFLSFFLVFLVERDEAHEGSLLLLDEAGLSLHPLAQKDLIAFFDNLSETNQIIHTTHSPFLIDTSNIDRVKAVYSDNNGRTVSSSDLRISDNKLSEQSIYAAHAALGLSVSDILLQGCQPIIVEGPSDQHYLNALKIYLIRNNQISPDQELVFMPSGGVRGIPQIVSIIGGKEGDLPIVLIDDDQSGREYRKKLCSGLYQGQKELLRNIGDYCGYEYSEVEDLIPLSLMTRNLNRVFRNVETEYIEDFIVQGQPLVPQIENFANKHGVFLERGWKVDLARSVKQELLNRKGIAIPEDYISRWISLFVSFNIPIERCSH